MARPAYSLFTSSVEGGVVVLGGSIPSRCYGALVSVYEERMHSGPDQLRGEQRYTCAHGLHTVIRALSREKRSQSCQSKRPLRRSDATHE